MSTAIEEDNLHRFVGGALSPELRQQVSLLVLHFPIAKCEQWRATVAIQDDDLIVRAEERIPAKMRQTLRAAWSGPPARSTTLVAAGVRRLQGLKTRGLTPPELEGCVCVPKPGSGPRRRIRAPKGREIQKQLGLAYEGGGMARKPIEVQCGEGVNSILSFTWLQWCVLRLGCLAWSVHLCLILLLAVQLPATALWWRGASIWVPIRAPVLAALFFVASSWVIVGYTNHTFHQLAGLQIKALKGHLSEYQGQPTGRGFNLELVSELRDKVRAQVQSCAVPGTKSYDTLLAAIHYAIGEIEDRERMARADKQKLAQAKSIPVGDAVHALYPGLRYRSYLDMRNGVRYPLALLAAVLACIPTESELACLAIFGLPRARLHDFMHKHMPKQPGERNFVG